MVSIEYKKMEDILRILKRFGAERRRGSGQMLNILFLVWKEVNQLSRSVATLSEARTENASLMESLREARQQAVESRVTAQEATEALGNSKQKVVSLQTLCETLNNDLRRLQENFAAREAELASSLAGERGRHDALTLERSALLSEVDQLRNSIQTNVAATLDPLSLKMETALRTVENFSRAENDILAIHEKRLTTFESEREQWLHEKKTLIETSSLLDAELIKTRTMLQALNADMDRSQGEKEPANSGVSEELVTRLETHYKETTTVLQEQLRIEREARAVILEENASALRALRQELHDDKRGETASSLLVLMREMQNERLQTDSDTISKLHDAVAKAAKAEGERDEARERLAAQGAEHERELQRLASEHTDIENKLNELRALLEGAQKAAATSSEAQQALFVQELKNQSITLLAQLEKQQQLQAASASESDEAQQLRERVAALEAEREKRNTELGALLESRFKEGRSSRDEEISVHTVHEKELNSELKALKKKLDAGQRERDEARGECDEARLNLEKMTAQQENMGNQLEATTRERQERDAHHAAQLRSLEETLEALRGTCRHHESQEAALARLRDELKEREAAWAAEKAQMQAQAEAMSASISQEQQQLAKEQENLALALAQAERRSGDESQALKAAKVELKAAEVRANEAANNIARLSAELDSTQAQLADTKKRLAELQDLQGKLVAADSKLEGKERELEMEKKKREEAEHRAATLEDAVTKARADCGGCEEAKAKLKQELEELRAQNGRVSNQADTDLLEARAMIQNLEGKLNGVRSEAGTQQGLAEAALEDLRRKLQTSKDHEERLAAELTALHAASDAQTSGSVAKLQEKEEEALAEQRQLSDTIEELRLRLATQADELTASENEVDRLMTELNELTSTTAPVSSAPSGAAGTATPRRRMSSATGVQPHKGDKVHAHLVRTLSELGIDEGLVTYHGQGKYKIAGSGS
jgi:chromosome segregation ATPase